MPDTADVASQPSMDDVGESGQVALENLDLFGRRPFLRSVPLRSTVFTEQRAFHVTSCHDLDVTETRVESRDVDALE